MRGAPAPPRTPPATYAPATHVVRRPAHNKHTGPMPRESLDLVPDERGRRAVQAVWTRLADAGLPSQAGHRSPTNKVHLTLVEAPSIADPARAGSSVGAMVPLSLPVTGLVVLGSARCAVALLVSAPPELVAAVAKLRTDVGRADLPWVPHVTLARQVPRDQAGRVVDAVGPHGITALRFVQLRHWQPRTQEVTTLVASPG